MLGSSLRPRFKVEMNNETLRASNLFLSVGEGQPISVEELASKFMRSRCQTGYEVESAGDDFIVYNVYTKLDTRRTACVKLIQDRTTGNTKVKSKSLITWALNWNKLIKPRR